MANPELGTKRLCPTTGRKFYDLNRDPIVSPYSGESWPRSAFDPIKTSRPADDEDEDDAVENTAAAEFVPLEDADTDAEKVAVAEDDIEIEDGIGPAEDDTFLEEEEEGEDDVSGLIDGEIEGEEEN